MIMECPSISRSKSYDNHQRSGNHYRDPNTNIWYTQHNLPVTTLYVALAKKLKYDQILKHFSAFGKVKTVRIHNTPSHSFCFVTFTKAESATNGLAAKRHTIAGRRIRVAIANSRHQSKELMMTTGSTTNFSSFNYDCLFEIFSQKSISIMDLCSVARSSTTLKEIANKIFSKRQEQWNAFRVFCLEWCQHSILDAKRIVVTFGSIMSGLSIDSVEVKEEYKEEWENLLNLVARCCSETLDLLYFVNLPDYLTIRISSKLSKLKCMHIHYCHFENMKKVFVDSESLLGLRVTANLSIENTFPKLLHLQYDGHDPMHFTEFISRHKNLKSLKVRSWWDDPLPLFPIITDNCKQLEKFYIAISIDVSIEEFKQAIKSLQTLEYLWKLEIGGFSDIKRSVTSILQELKYFNSLESLQLSNFLGDSECILALFQLKRLRELELNFCEGFPLNKLGDLHQLIKLSIKSDEAFNVVDLIKRLNNLETLTLRAAFKIDKKLYLRIVKVIKSRPLRFPQNLELICDSYDATAGDLQYDVCNSRIVKLYLFQGDSWPPEALQTLQV